MSTWKKYGGLSHVESQNSISAYALSVDIFTLRQAYFGTFDICGEFHVSGNALVDNDVRSNNVTVTNDISCNQLFVTMGSNHFGDMNVTGNVTVSSGDLRIVNGNVDISNNLYLSKKLFLGNSGIYLYGTDISGNIGINTTSPQSALDVQSTKPFLLNLATSNSTNYSVLSKTVAGDGVIVYADASNARLDFFVDGSTNVASVPDARLACTPGGNFTIDVSSNTAILSNVSISNRSSQVNAHVHGETAVIYDNSASIYQYAVYQNSQSIAGNALTLVANDASSVTFMNMVSSDKKGLAIGGGTYPNDMTKAMGTIGLVDSCGNYTPSVNIVDASSNVYRKFAMGINTYAPEVNNYVLSMNGPTHLKNGHLTITTQANIEIYKLSLARTNTNYGIAIGSPYTTDASFDDPTHKYRQKLYFTTNGGEKWNDISSDPDNGINETTIEIGVSGVPRYIHDVFMVDASLSFLCANGIINYSNSSGEKWYGVSNVNSTRNYYSAYVYGSRAFFADSTGNVTYFNYDSSIYTDFNGISATAVSSIGFLPIGYSGIPHLSGSGTALFLAAGNSIYRLSNISATVTASSLYTNTYGAYNSIYALDASNVIAVGSGVITWTNNGFSTRVDISVPGVVLNSVHIIDASNAIAVGNGGTIMYTVDGYATWKSVSPSIMNSSGNGNTLLDSSFNLTNVRCVDINQFYITKTIRTYVSASTLGNTSLFHCYVPELFNNANNLVLDMSGSSRISGDVNINDGGRLKTNNSTFYLLDTCANTIRMGGEAANVFIGNVASSTTTVNSSLVTLKDASFNGNVVIGGKSQMLGNTTFTNSYVFSSYYDSSDTMGSINIGGLNYSSLPGMVSNPGSRNIKVGNFNNSVDMSCVIYIGGAQDKILLGGSVYNNASLNVGPYIFINFMADLNSSPNCGIKFGENGKKDAGYFLISNDMGGFIMKSTTATNVVKLDVSNLVYNGAGNQGIITLSKLSPGIGIDASYSIQSSNIDLSNVFLKNWTLSSTNLQTVDTSMSVIGKVAIGKSSFIANTNIDISGNALVSSRLGVGNTAVNGAYVFDVLGDSNLGGILNVTGLTKAMGNLAVNQGSVASGYSVDISGNVNISGNLVGRSGASFTAGNVAVFNGNVSINRSLANIGYALDVSGNVNVSGNITVANGFTVSAGTVSFPAASISVSSISGLGAVLAGINSAGNVGINQSSVTAGYALDISGNTKVSGNITAGNGISVSSGNLIVSTGFAGINRSSVTAGFALDVSGNTNVSGNMNILGNVNVVKGVSSGQKMFGHLISSKSTTYITSGGDIFGYYTSTLSYNSGITGTTNPFIVSYTPIAVTQYYTFVFNYNYTRNPIGFSMYVYPNYTGGSPGQIYNIGVVAANSLSGSISSTHLIAGGMTVGTLAVGFYADASNITTTGVSLYILTGDLASPTAMPLYVAGNTTVTGAINLNGITVNSGTVSFPPSSISNLAINGLSTSIPGINTEGNVAINKSSVTAGYVIDVSGNTNISGNITVSNGFTVSAGTVSFPAASISVTSISGLGTALAGINSAGNVAINKTSVTSGYALDISGNVNVSGYQRFVSSSAASGVNFGNATTCISRIYNDSNLIFWSKDNMYFKTGGTATDNTHPTGASILYLQPGGVGINNESVTSGYVLDIIGNTKVSGNITVSNGFAVSAGTVTFPANSISASAISGGVSVAGINSTGNVAINKASASILGNTQLDISGNLVVSGGIFQTNTSPGINFGGSNPGAAIVSKIYDNNDLHLWVDSNFYVDIGGTVTNTASFPSSATTMIYASTTGVGIKQGSVTANYALDVNGNTKVSGNITVGNGLVVTAGGISASGQIINFGTSAPTMSGGNISATSIPDGALTSNVALLSGAQNFIGAKTFNGNILVGTTSAIVLKWGSTSYGINFTANALMTEQPSSRIGDSGNLYLWTNDVFYIDISGTTPANPASALPSNALRMMMVNSLGVSINTTSVAAVGYALDVNGNTNVSGNITAGNGIVVTAGGINASGQIINFGTSAPTMYGNNIATGTIPVAAINGSTSVAGINSAGAVAINKALPVTNGYELDVNGDVLVGGALRVNGETSFNGNAILGSAGALVLKNLGNTGINFGNISITGQQNSKIYDNANLHIWTDDVFYIDIGGTNPSNPNSLPTGAVTTMIYATTSGVGINTTALVTGCALTVNGNLYANGNVSANFFNSTSDGRLKTDIKPLLNNFDTIQNINPVSFVWKGNAKPDCGFIAQNVFNRLPNMRPNNWSEFEDPVDASGNPVYYSIDYSKMTPHLWGAVDDLIRENTQLKQRIARIEALLGI